MSLEIIVKNIVDNISKKNSKKIEESFSQNQDTDAILNSNQRGWRALGIEQGRRFWSNASNSSYVVGD